MLDLTRCRFFEDKEIAVATGETITDEGIPLMSTLEGGEEVVEPVDGAVTDIFAGFSYGEPYTPTTLAYVYTASVPAAGVFTIQLPKTNIVAAQIHVYDNTAVAALTEGVVANGVFSCVDATGLLTFDVAQAGNSMTVTFRYAPTTQEVMMENNMPIYSPSGSSELGQIGVILHGEVYTDVFNSAIAWDDGPANVRTGVGRVTNTNEGAVGAIIPNCTIIHVPSTDFPFVGLRF